MECQSAGVSDELLAAELGQLMEMVGLLLARLEDQDRAENYLRGLTLEIRRYHALWLSESVGTSLMVGGCGAGLSVAVCRRDAVRTRRGLDSR